MGWILGIDEAGYGPNLGPFVMSAVSCRLPDVELDPWRVLCSVVRRASDVRDDRLVVDDSKLVYSTASGLAGLERGLAALLPLPDTLFELNRRLAESDHAELGREVWYTGKTTLPIAEGHEVLHQRFTECCAASEIQEWRVASVIVCPTRFNQLIDRHDSKAGVLGEGFIQLLRQGLQHSEGEQLAVFVDKQGGRNGYSAQIQQALTTGWVQPIEETAQRSRYRLLGADREVGITFQPRADQQFFCVALASMVSKYLRELLMNEFNAFWCAQVPGLKPTAGYPGDAPRFFEAIRATARNLQIQEDAIWRKR